MQPLIQQIFPKDYKHIIKLAKDSDSKKLILDNMSDYLMQSPNIILGHELNQLFLLLKKASFAEDEEEILVVVRMIMENLNNTNIFPSLLHDKGFSFSSKCLISLAFFKPYMWEKTERYARSTPNYYRQVSQSYLRQEGLKAVSEHHVLWENQLHNFLV